MSKFTIEATFLGKIKEGETSRMIRHSDTVKDALAYMNSFNQDEKTMEVTITDDDTGEIIGKMMGR